VSGRTVSAFAPDGAPEIRPGTDLVEVLLGLLGPGELADGDLVVVTSKVVAKAEGRVVDGDRDDHLDAETARLVARRGPTRIVRTHHGLTMAAAGIDASNVEAGRAVLLPRDPDASARALLAELTRRTGLRLGVVVTDTAGRAWRVGQTDLAVGAAGVRVVDPHAGRQDAFGNELVVTAPAVADEVAGLVELAQGKLTGRPFAVVRGRPDLVLGVEEPGDVGAAALVRPEGEDLFGFGAREAVCRALAADPTDQVVFGSPVTAAELSELVAAVLGLGAEVEPGGTITVSTHADDAAARLDALAFAHGWRRTDGTPDLLRWRPAGP